MGLKTSQFLFSNLELVDLLDSDKWYSESCLKKALCRRRWHESKLLKRYIKYAVKAGCLIKHKFYGMEDATVCYKLAERAGETFSKNC